MLARTMSHWYRLHVVQISRRWNSDIDHSMSDRSFYIAKPELCHFLYHFDIAADVGSISTWCSSAIWEKFYCKFFWYEYIIGWASWMLPYKIRIFSYFDVCHEFPISMERLNCKPIIIFSQMLWILSIRLIEREIDMHIYCSQLQIEAELYISR